MLANLGVFLYRRRIAALCIAVAVVIGATVFGLGLFRSLSNNGFVVEDSESSRATQLLQTKLGDSGDDVIILLRSDTLSGTDPDFAQAANALLAKLNTRPEVASLTDYYTTHIPDFISKDGHETFAVLRLKGNDTTTKQNEYTSLKPLLTSQTLQVEVSGTIPVLIALTDQATHDLQQAETLTLPIVLLLLLVVFGGLIAASLPLLIGVLAFLVTLAVLRGFTTVMDISVSSLDVVMMLGLGLAIDYSLFILSRFREELVRNQQDVRTSLERTMATAGRTVIFSALTVSTSLLSLLLFPMSLMHSIGLGAISAVLIAMVLSITILPILLALLGPRVNALSLRRLIRPRRSPATNIALREQQGTWYRLSEIIMRRPIPVTMVLVLLLVSLVIPFMHIKLATSGITALPPDNEARIASDRLSQDFAHQGNAQITIAVTTPGNALSAENLASLDSYVKNVQAIPGVIQVQSLVTINPNLDLSAYQRLYAHPELNPQISPIASNLAHDDFTKVTVAIQPADHSSAATTLVKQIRALHAPGGLTAQVGGVTPAEIDILAGIDATLPGAFLMIFASIFVLLFLMTGSLVMPLKAITLNMLSLSATFGGLVWIFQDGHLQNILHFQSSGRIDATQPVVVFAIAFGLSMDYEVFVLSRIKERFDETGNNRLAVSSGLQSTGWLITSAALLMAIVVGGFGLAKTLAIQEIGIGLAIAVVMDATLIRMVLLPATMHLLGTLNWWAPAPLRGLWRHIGLKETDAMPVPAFNAQVHTETIIPALHDNILTIRQNREKLYNQPVEPAPLAPVNGGEVALQPSNNVISTRTASGEEMMGSEVLLWPHPEKKLVNGSLLIVGNNQFCVLMSRGTVLNVYEIGQHIVQMPDDSLVGVAQMTFDDEPIPQHEALYINRAKLVTTTSGVALSCDMVEINYSVDWSIHVATREDAARLVQHLSYRSYPQEQAQSLHIRDMNMYVGPAIEQTMNQIIQIASLEKFLNLQLKEIPQYMHEQLQRFLSTYGVTVDEVQVRVAPRDERVEALLSRKSFGMSELDAVNHYAATTKNSMEQHLNGQQEELAQELSTTWQNRLASYTNEIAAIQAELESMRSEFGRCMDAQSARLQELSGMINVDIQASAPMQKVTPHSRPQSSGTTGQFKMRLTPLSRGVPIVAEK